MPGGPQPQTRDARLTLVQDIADRLLALYQQRVLAIGLYGSTARGTDGPYSDIEMFCILDDHTAKHAFEWVYGAGKAEVDVSSEQDILRRAASVESRWPLTHGCLCHVQPFYDPTNFFARLCTASTSQPAEAFTEAIRELIVDDIYEAIGKLRNAWQQGNIFYLPELAFSLAKAGAFLIGLANRTCYTTGSRVLQESLTLPDRPASYDALCQMVMHGELSDPECIFKLCDAFWTGVERWANARGIAIEEPRRIPF